MFEPHQTINLAGHILKMSPLAGQNWNFEIEFLQPFRSKSSALYVKTPHFRAAFSALHLSSTHFGTPGAIRTHGLWSRSAFRNRIVSILYIKTNDFNTRIRTYCELLRPYTNTRLHLNKHQTNTKINTKFPPVSTHEKRTLESVLSVVRHQAGRHSRISYHGRRLPVPPSGVNTLRVYLFE